jgi:pyruvate formate-lyase/glycerol dehydratase family glycyl radical enzyme
MSSFSWMAKGKRIRAFREEILNTPQSLCAERAVLYTEAHRIYRKEQTAILRARCLQNILEKMTIYIEDNTLLVGNQASVNRAAPVFIECAVDWLIEELDDIDKRDGDRFIVKDIEKERVRAIAPYWENNSLKDKGLAAFPDKARTFYDIGIIKSEGNITAGDAHLAVNYKKLIELGLIDFKRRAKEEMEKLDLTDFRQLKKLYFYKGVLIALDAVIAFSHRYADLAEKKAGGEKDQLRREELLEIARICRKVPECPADTLHEALQSIWLLQVVLQIESSGHSLSYGRLDQYLIDIYRRDLQAGRIDEEGAQILFENLWIKSLTINKIRSYAQSRYNAGSPMYQNVTIGGQTPDGKDGVNELSWIILRSVSSARLTQPNLTVRYHKRISSEFMQECIEVIRKGFGMPAFNSDEVIIPSLMELGVKKEDAYDYSAIGCVEVAVPGKWGLRVAGMSFINLPRTLLAAMNDGIDLASGVRICEGHGHFTEMESFEQLMDAWDAVLREVTRQSVIVDMCADMVLEQEIPDILCSALVDDCIGRGLNLKEGGAVYDYISGLQVGIANLADSLAAVKYCVYENNLLTREQLWNALCSNYKGAEGELVRQTVINSAPKYGNDVDYVDKLAVEAYDSYIDEIEKYRNTRYGRGPIGGKYFPGTSTVAANVPLGLETPATPDGRKAWEPLAEGCSPSHGVDTHGPTAVFKTLSKLRQDKITGGVLLNQKVTPEILDRSGNRKKLEMLIRTYFDELKGFHVQYNVVSRETLLEAQKHPEKYNDLIVRVAGYSAFFNVLSRITQDDIIARTEQQL